MGPRDSLPMGTVVPSVGESTVEVPPPVVSKVMGTD